MSKFYDITCKSTGKLLNEAVIAGDGYVYEKEYIEELFYKYEAYIDTIISPTTKTQMDKYFIIFTELNKYLEDFYNKHPELITLRYISKENIIKVFKEMIDNETPNIEDIISYVEKYTSIEYNHISFNINNVNIDKTIHKNTLLFDKIINNEKGIKLFLSHKITATSSHFYIDHHYVIGNSELYMQLYDHLIINKNLYKHNLNIYFYNACLYGRYDLMIKLYNIDNILTKTLYNAYGTTHNMFSAGIKYLNILKFLHNADNSLYKYKLYDQVNMFMYSCIYGNLDIIKFIYEIDNSILYTNRTYKHLLHNINVTESALEFIIYNNAKIENIKYLFTIDKDIFNKDINKKEIINFLKKDLTKEVNIQILELIVDNL